MSTVKQEKKLIPLVKKPRSKSPWYSTTFKYGKLSKAVVNVKKTS
jgi:hypothetical protein